jgi:hypothetical protein
MVWQYFLHVWSLIKLWLKSKKNQSELKGGKTLLLQSNHLGILYFHHGWLENQALMHHGSLDNLNNNLCYEWGATFATNE